jgi:hypothetical protein
MREGPDDFLSHLMQNILWRGRHKRKQEDRIADQQYMTGGYINPVLQNMFMRDYHRSGRISDPFGMYGHKMGWFR